MASAEDPPATPASQETRPGKVLHCCRGRDHSWTLLMHFSGILSRPKADIAPQGGAKDDSATDLGQTQAVRFSSVNQEIEPLYSLRTETITRTSDEARIPQEISPENQELLKKLSQSLQRHRTSNFTFEPVSLPTSRVSPCAFDMVVSVCTLGKRQWAAWCLPMVSSVFSLHPSAICPDASVFPRQGVPGRACCAP